MGGDKIFLVADGSNTTHLVILGLDPSIHIPRLFGSTVPNCCATLINKVIMDPRVEPEGDEGGDALCPSS
ncbi:hypothetical protein [uncultured Maritalea sp.]|jgi:hypothetical protein|uniref:hypothetical protein n=1 Tax=uncultured Maritalea sp. TaxID=757249 RepID=UPI00262C4195|nr:hypothetical protein [uncultured Maritalea sp.]